MAYKGRTSDENRLSQITKWENEALAIYKKKYAETINWNQFHIEGDYDPDNECFLIRSEQFGQLTVKVPRGKTAKEFISYFDSVKVSQPDFYFSDNYIGLDKLTFTLPNGQQAVYDSRAQNTYAHLNISYDLELTKLRELNIENRNRQITQQPISNLSDVDMQIPQTGITNDETYAVIIGNEHYHYESQTRFSSNDAKIFYQYYQNIRYPIPEHIQQNRCDLWRYADIHSIPEKRSQGKKRECTYRILFFRSWNV